MNIIRISEAGMCPRALSAQKLNQAEEAVPTWLATAAEEGNLHEGAVKDKLHKEGYKIKDHPICPKCYKEYGIERKGIHVEYKQNSLLFIGHMDGTVTKDGITRVLEVKSMGHFEFQRWMKGMWKEFPRYADQITLYMAGSGLKEALYCVKNRSSGYIDRQTIVGYPSDLKSIIDKINLVETHVAIKEMCPAEADFSTLECKRCRFKVHCIKTKEEMSEVDEQQLSLISDDWRKGEALVSEGTILVNRAKAQFKEHMIASSLERLRFNELAISYYHVVRESYDKDALLQMFGAEKLLPAIKKSEYDTLRIDDLKKE